MAPSRLPGEASLPSMAPDKVQEGKTADDNPADAAPTFPQFGQLPPEIQLLIWEEAAASPVLTPGYALFNDMLLAIDNFDHDKHDVDARQESPVLANLKVLTSWSPLMHTCCDSRAAALRSPALTHLYSWTAKFAVPYRLFDPAIDYLYISDEDELDTTWTGITLPVFHTLPAKVQALFPNQVKCVMPLPTWWDLKPDTPTWSLYDFNECRPMWSLYTFNEFRDVHGVAMHPAKGFFDPCEPIAFREQMRLAQVDEFHAGCVVELLMKKFYTTQSFPRRLTPCIGFL